jgi:signal transduction histidine kinase
VLIRKNEIKKLSDDIRRIIDGEEIFFDFRDNREGVWSILKNDIHTLANLKNEQVASFKRERDLMSDTLANISHQLKTPLTSMMVMADLLENAPPDKQSEFISNIITGLTRMEWLVSALLKMAKLDAGAIEFNAKNIQARELVTLALEPLQILIDVKNQNVEIFCETGLFCDRKWTAEALTNIIKNASEYSPDGGKIRIESGTNPICRWISVTDSGEGISNTEIAGLFRRFEGSRSDKGYGIGLPLALAIMRGQNGDVEVDGGSPSGSGGNGVGATFTMKFYK